MKWLKYFRSLLTTVPYLAGLNESKKEVTELYPDPISGRSADDLPPKSRGLLFNQIDICTGCGDCAQECPTQCIRIESEPGQNENKTWVSVFDLDLSRCIFCGMCVRVCEPNSLTHKRDFEASVSELKDMVLSFGKGPVTEELRERWEYQKKIELGEGS